MPELPEVEAVRRLAERTLIGRRIEAVEVADDRIVFDRNPPDEVAGAVIGRAVIASKRKGKYFWLELDEPPHLVMHFGMSGRFAISDAGQPPPKYWKLATQLSDGLGFVMTDMRRLGRIRLAFDPPNEPPISLLGFDALNEIPSTAKLGTLLAPRSAPLKAVLLDQSFSAGVGNWVADEVLYHARLSPLRPANSLTNEELRRLRSALRAVVLRAVEVDADATRFPSSWLFHRRWDRRIGLSARGESLTRQRVGGRTTVWAPNRQC